MAYAELSEPEYSRVGAPNVLGRERKLKAEKEIHFFAKEKEAMKFRTSRSEMVRKTRNTAASPASCTLACSEDERMG